MLASRFVRLSVVYALIGISIGIGLVYGGMPEAEPIAAVSWLVAIAGVAIFAAVVFRATRTA